MPVVVFRWHLFNELVAERTSGSKALMLQCHVLFGLRIKGGVLNQAIDKQPQVVLHLDGEGEEYAQLCALLTGEYLDFQLHIKKIKQKMRDDCTWKGLMTTPALFFLFTTSMSLLTTWSVT